MYLIYLTSGKVLATSTKEMKNYLCLQYTGYYTCVTFCENLDEALEKATEVIE